MITDIIIDKTIKVIPMTYRDDKTSTDAKRKVNKRFKLKGGLSMSTWILLIISFTLLAFAFYTIEMRVIDIPVESGKLNSTTTQTQ